MPCGHQRLCPERAWKHSFRKSSRSGDSVAFDTPFCDVESIKTVSDVYSPVTGKVISVNEEVIDNPTLINTDPYGSWFAVIGEITAKGELLTSEEYDEYIKTLK